MSFQPPSRKSKFVVHKDMKEYDSIGQVGEGTYGQVFKAKHKSSSKFVALKKLYLKEDDKGKEKNRDGFPITAIREIEILRSLKHPNIVELLAMVSISSEKMDMYMVFEYMDHDLTGILTNSAVVYNLPQIKCLSNQLFQGLEYLHSLNIIHRDIKGANLLLNNQGYLKIADFGLARRIHIDRDSGEPMEDFEYTNRVVTLWYRCPELLLGSTSYGFEVDLWSAGCILMEFYTKSAIFQGRTEIDQLELIFQLCGSPNTDSWPELNNLPWYGLITFPTCERKLVKEFSNSSYGLTNEFVKLVDSLLQLDPLKRPTASETLQHPFFKSEPPFACEPQEYYLLTRLPKIEGDWHEYESKIRKKKGTTEISAQLKQGNETPDMSSSQRMIDDIESRAESVKQESMDSYKRPRSRSISRERKRPRSRSLERSKSDYRSFDRKEFGSRDSRDSRGDKRDNRYYDRGDYRKDDYKDTPTFKRTESFRSNGDYEKRDVLESAFKSPTLKKDTFHFHTPIRK